jgi:integrase
VLTVAEVMDLAERVPDRFRAMILVATFGTLRYGEASGLQRADLDLDAGTVFVRRSLTEVRGTGLVLGPPKSRAGLRRVSLPGVVVEELKRGSFRLKTVCPRDEPRGFRLWNAHPSHGTFIGISWSLSLIGWSWSVVHPVMLVFRLGW